MDLVDKVAGELWGEYMFNKDRIRDAKAAIAVVLQDAIKWSEKTTTNAVVPVYLRMYARENGVSLDE